MIIKFTNLIKYFSLIIFISTVGITGSITAAEKTVIYVSQKIGNDSNDGLTRENSVATIGKGIEILKQKDADILMVGPGTYYERPLFNYVGSSISKKVWIVAEPRGEAIISNMWREASEGKVEWKDVGNNIWSAPHASSFMGSYKDKFLFHYNSLDELKAETLLEVNKPPYGFTTQNGNLYLQLPEGENPNGQKVMLTENFGESIIEISNSPYLILDGFVIEGGGNGDNEGHAVKIDKASHHITYRNLIFRYCRRCVQISDNGIAEWCEYTYPNFYNFVEDIRVLNNGITNGIYTLVKKVFSSNGNAYYEGAFAVSFRDEPSENVYIRYCYFHETFDAENLGQFNNSSTHHNVYNYNYDDNNELECWKHETHHGVNLRVHDNLMLNCMAGPMSHQDVGGNTLYGPHYVYRNVIYITDADHSHPAFVIKNKNGHEDLNIYYYHNILMNVQGTNNGWDQTNWLFWNNQHRDALHFYNNIISFDNCTNTDIEPKINTDYNLLINNKDMPWLRGINGIYSGTTEDPILFINKERLNFGVQPGSIVENSGMILSKELPDSDHKIIGMPDIGPFEVGENPGTEWPRPMKTTFYDHPPEGFEKLTSIKQNLQDDEQPLRNNKIGIFPNPFNSSTKILFNLDNKSNVSLKIYNSNGELVEEIFRGNLPSGEHQLIWDGLRVSSGCYYVVLRNNSNTEVNKIALLK